MTSMNDASDISSEVKGFLRGWVASYEQLQTLLLLRQQRNDSFSLASVAEALHVSEIIAAEALDHIRSVSLVEVVAGSDPPLFKYAPGSTHLSDLVDQLADAWENNQLRVMNQMSANAIERVRTGALRTFADAFLLERKKTDG